MINFKKIKNAVKIGLIIAPLCLNACKSEQQMNHLKTRYVIKSYFEQIHPKKIAWGWPGLVYLLTDLDNDGSYDIEEGFVDYNMNLKVRIKEGYENKIPQTKSNLEKLKCLRADHFSPKIETVNKSYFDNLILEEKIKFLE